MRVSIFATIALLLLVAFVGAFASGASVNLAKHAAATPALAGLSGASEAKLSSPAPSSAAASTATSTKPSPQNPAQQRATSVILTAPQMPIGNIATAASAIRGAVVNILCYAQPGSGLSSISGSGVVITPSGIILTNAHIAQYYLLTNKGVSCSVRTGSPAQDAYTAGLLYISPSWVKANSTVLTEANPTGTGQYDYALLGITGSETSTPLPSSFPFVPLASTPPVVNEPVVIGSYAAQFLTPGEIQGDLAPTIVYGSIKNVYTFVANTIDVVSLGGSAAAQEGSSGGGIVDASDSLTGTITTSTIVGNTAARTLSAITASYIRADYATETGAPIDLLLQRPISISLSDFAPLIPNLESIITANLSH